MELIQKIIDFLALPQVVVAAGFILEMAMRLLKTEKPKSFLLLAKAFLEKIPVVAQKIVSLLLALISFIDNILPQNLNNKIK